MPETHRNQASPNLRYGSNVGQPITRRDAILKVTGRASYAADNHPEGMLYAVCAVSTIARGRVTHLDVEAAKAHPQVVEVITPANRPPLAGDPEAQARPLRVPYGGAAERPRALRQPADCARRCEDAGGGDGRRRAA